MDHYGVIGNPIQHSKSPEIFKLFANQTQQLLIYERILVEKESLEAELSKLKTRHFKGVNVTLPFKQQAFALMDTVSERAKQAQAVNTITLNPDGTLSGDNTDGIGFIRDLTRNHRFDIRGKKVLLLGAGGAIRGVMPAILNEEPAAMTIANRTAEKAIALAKSFSGNIQACGLSALNTQKFDLVVNGTSASLHAEDLALPDGLFNAGACSYDMVYGKGQTPYLQWSEQQGAKVVVDGSGMLIEQAAESFYLWRGTRPVTQGICEVIA